MSDANPTSSTPAQSDGDQAFAQHDVQVQKDPRLAALLEQERLLRVSGDFGAAAALGLCFEVASLAQDYDRGVGMRVYRESDGMVLAQWFMDDKAPRNEAFVEGKRQAALRCGHASLWMEVAHELAGEWQDEFDALSGAKDLSVAAECCPAAGAFPLRTADGEWIATLSLSGLHDGLDQEIVVRALADYLGFAYGEDVPAVVL